VDLGFLAAKVKDAVDSASAAIINLDLMLGFPTFRVAVNLPLLPESGCRNGGPAGHSLGRGKKGIPIRDGNIRNSIE
jgi:hypothetical protein